MQPTVIAIAGASGDLGFRIAAALLRRGATVRALVRPDLDGEQRERLEEAGITLAVADPHDSDAVAGVLVGVACLVSALNGLEGAILGRQGALLDAAVAAGVPRFISSDFSLDFTRTRPGDNRNMDLRRAFMARADRAPIKMTTILNGAFMDMLGAEMPIIQPAIRRVLYWGRADQTLDFTTKDDVAAFAAAAALDPDTPRILRIAGDSVTAQQLAEILSEITGRVYRPLWVGNMATLGLTIRIARRFAAADEVFPAFQGMQYMRDMMSGRGRLSPLDNRRYPDLAWTKVRERLALIPFADGDPEGQPPPRRATSGT